MKNIFLLLLCSVYCLFIFYAHQQGQIPDLIVYGLCACNVVSILFYGMDKLAAMKQWQRTPEKHFYILALVGGWPGSIMGQIVFNHKTSKVSFRRWFYAMSLLNITLVVSYFLKVNGIL